MCEIRKPVFVAFGDLKAAGFHIIVIVVIQSAKIGDFQCRKVEPTSTTITTVADLSTFNGNNRYRLSVMQQESERDVNSQSALRVAFPGSNIIISLQFQSCSLHVFSSQQDSTSS